MCPTMTYKHTSSQGHPTCTHHTDTQPTNTPHTLLCSLTHRHTPPTWVSPACTCLAACCGFPGNAVTMVALQSLGCSSSAKPTLGHRQPVGMDWIQKRHPVEGSGGGGTGPERHDGGRAAQSHQTPCNLAVPPLPGPEMGESAAHPAPACPRQQCPQAESLPEPLAFLEIAWATGGRKELGRRWGLQPGLLGRRGEWGPRARNPSTARRSR